MNGSPTRNNPWAPVVVGTGLVALDVVIPPEEAAQPKLWAGGTCGNVLLALSYLGWQSYPVARLKNDAACERICDDFRRWGVCLDFVEAEKEGSTPVIVHRIGRTADGKPFHTFSKRCPSCGAVLPGYKPVLMTTAEAVIQRLDRPQVFFFDRVSRAALRLAKACSERGALVVFEPSGLGTPQLFGEALDLAHVVKYSHERMGEVDELRSARKPLLQVETLGRDGLRYRSRLPRARRHGWQLLKAIPLRDSRDTAGAGDWCSAGLLHRLAGRGLEGALKASGEQLDTALAFGQLLAAWTCRYEGARGGMYAVDREQFLRDTEDLQRLVALSTAHDPHATRPDGPAVGGFCSACSQTA
jgi:sugar/nucleoside kinase (ribokinase family)